MLELKKYSKQLFYKSMGIFFLRGWGASFSVYP